jgi:elongator complex protein 6
MTPLDDLLSAQLTPAQPGHLSLVTCVLGASASWFSQSLLSKIITSSSSDTTTIVIHISFIHEAGFHRDCVRKLGVDLAQHTRSGRYCFIDGLSGLLLPPAPSQKGCVTLANGLQALGADIKARIRKEAEGKKAYLLVENPDVLLAAGGFSAMEVINELLDWHEVRLAPHIPPSTSPR